MVWSPSYTAPVMYIELELELGPVVPLALKLEPAVGLRPGTTDMELAMGPTSAELELALELELAVAMALAMALELAVQQARLLGLKLDPEP